MRRRKRKEHKNTRKRIKRVKRKMGEQGKEDDNVNVQMPSKLARQDHKINMGTSH